MITRVLVLHDVHSSIGATKTYLRALEDRLFTRHNIEFIYVQGTYPSISYKKNIDKQKTSNLDDGDGKSSCDNCDSSNGPVSNDQQGCVDPLDFGLSDLDENHTIYSPRQWFKSSDLVGLDASIYYLHQIWSKERFVRPFSGIIGIGQGAALAALIPHLKGRDLEFFGLQFMVLWNGYPLDFSCCCSSLIDNLFFKSLVDIFSSSKAIEKSLTVKNLPTLHIIASKVAKALSKYFDESATYEYEEGNSDHGRTFNVIGRWCVDRRKHARTALSGGDITLLTTQQARLSLLEEYATQIVAHTVASNPPKALMAIIAPNAVGGWTGQKDRNFEDGGGAPCPREFLMKREERQKHEGSIGREHPCAKD